MKSNKLTRTSLTPWLLALIAALPGMAVAQNQTITGDLSVTNGFKTGTSDSAGGAELRLGGLIIGKGIYGGAPALLPSDQGAGTRMLWYPAKAAFRAGSVDWTQWDDSKIGKYSAALGYSTTASGLYSTAFGSYTGAFGNWSTAMGCNSAATGSSSMAMGSAVSASGTYSTGMGYFTVASGYCSTSFGFSNVASGESSTAMGYASCASGDYSTSMGYDTTADSYASTVIGRLNIGGGSAGEWIPTDPLFEIGNGIANYENDEPLIIPSNALTVYKNGNMEVQGTLKVGGSITSGESGNITPSPGNATGGLLALGDSWAGGPYSVAIGSYSTKATGNSSFASGVGAVASGYGSTAFGGGSQAVGADSLASGYESKASGLNSTASGFRSEARGANSTATGAETVASGYGSTASGFRGHALGAYSYAGGDTTSAVGDRSIAMGHWTNAASASEIVFGRLNAEAPSANPYEWNELDALFRVGNGHQLGTDIEDYSGPFGALSDALTILKNGQTTLTNKAWKNRDTSTPAVADPSTATTDSGGDALVVEGHTRLKGKVLIERQGDLSMAGFEAGERP